MAFAVATCPNCSREFRLVWRIGKRRIKPSQRLRLVCPLCGNAFEITAVDLAVFDAGKEQFPVTYTVEPKSLI
ncbi:MAG: hypothetical protein DMG32_24770 [Acidobacteria bacterium]|nr:MAG: hypothetical protein DMG32_24770 [Acidobacteriota bacterium]